MITTPIPPFSNLPLDPELIKQHVSSWERSEQAIFTAVFIHKKPREQVAHDLGLPFSFLEGKIEELTQRFRQLPS